MGRAAARPGKAVLAETRIGQVVNEVQVTLALDPYLSLKAASTYCSLSVSTLRGALTAPEHALPCYRLSGKILLRRSELDRWLAGFRQVGAQDLDALVDAVMGDLRSESNQPLDGPRRQAHANTGSAGGGPMAVARGLRA